MYALSYDLAGFFVSDNPSVRPCFFFAVTGHKNTVLVLMQSSTSVVKTGSAIGVLPLSSNTVETAHSYEEVRLFFSCTMITLLFKLYY